MSNRTAKGMNRRDFVSALKRAGWEINGDTATKVGHKPIRIPNKKEVSIGVIRQAGQLNAA